MSADYRDAMVEMARNELEKLREQNKRLRDALAGEVGLVQLILVGCSDSEKALVITNHRHVEALAALGDSGV